MSLEKPVRAIAAHEHAGETAPRCPTCEQPIPHTLSAEVAARIARHEGELRARLEAQVAAERREAEARLRQEMEAMRVAAVRDLERVRAETQTAAEAALAGRLAAAEQARVSAEQRREALEREQAHLIEARLASERERLERDKIAAVQAEQQRAFDDKQKSLAKIAELQRQLENKSAQDLGEAPEADLFEMLKAEFPEDRISRVEKGASGADVIHDVSLNGRPAGRIVYDSKNRSAWRNDYVTKLRADQIEAQADHAVLASKVFPAGLRDLHLQEGVIVVSPQRVLVVAQLLRKHIVQTYSLRSSNEARAQKTEALYAFIMSERCAHLLGSIDMQAGEMVDLDRKEEKAHQVTWKKRAELIRSVQRAHGDLTFEIDRIIGVAANRASGDDAA